MTITVQLTPDVEQKLDRLARDTKRSKGSLASEALTDYVERELLIVEGILQGMADVAAGRTIPHEQAMDEVDALIEEIAARKIA